MATAIGKYWITKRAITVVPEALECLGGNGHVEAAPLLKPITSLLTSGPWFSMLVAGSSPVRLTTMGTTVGLPLNHPLDSERLDNSAIPHDTGQLVELGSGVLSDPGLQFL